MRESFVFYRSFYESIRLLPKKYQLQCFDALCKYALNEEPFEGVPGTVEAILKSFKPQVDANNRRYENGCKGGRPKGTQDETKAKPKRNQNETKAKRNDNDNDNVNVNVNVNDNDNDNDNAVGCGGGFYDDDFFNIFKRLGGDGIDKIYDVYPETGGNLIQEVFEEVKAKRREVKDPVAYVLGYAKKVGWSDET